MRSHLQIEPGSPEHMRVISASKVAAILGVSRWESSYRLWHRMKGLIDPEPPKDKFMVGHAMELAAAEMYREEHPGWRVSKAEAQFVTDAYGFPAVVTLDRRVSRGKHRRVLEIKTTESIEDWGDPFTDEAPMDYLIQTIAQMGFSGYTDHPAHLMVLGPRIRDRHIYEIPFAEDIWEWILADCKTFWDSLAGTTAPPLDNSVATYECVRELHPDIDKCTHVKKGDTWLCGGVEAPRNLILRIRDARYEVDRWETELRGAKTELLDLMGSGQHARIGNVIVANRQNGTRGSVALVVNKKPLPDLPDSIPNPGGEYPAHPEPVNAVQT